MDIAFARGEAPVRQIQAELPDPPPDMAVRRMWHIFEENGHLRRRQESREVVYFASLSKVRAGASALQHVIDTFFGGAVDEAIAVHLAKKEPVSPEQLVRIQELIKEAGKKDR